VLVISPDGRDGSATIHQDADIDRIRLKPGQTVTHKLRPGRGAWVHITAGRTLGSTRKELLRIHSD
jgi:redox-sensitive bicupin YhaK (pirin superfamily)